MHVPLVNFDFKPIKYINILHYDTGCFVWLFCCNVKVIMALLKNW